MRISDWSSDVCSSDLVVRRVLAGIGFLVRLEAAMLGDVEQGCGEFVVGQPAIEAVRTRLPRVRRLVAVAGNLACLRLGFPLRSAERRVGKACSSTCRTRWWPFQ